MKRFIALLAVAGVLLLLGSCSEDPPPAPVTPEAATLAKGPGPGGGGPPGGGGHTDIVGNNNSFPVIPVNFDVTTVTTETFTVQYEGPYTGLTQAEQDFLALNGPWYAQKTEGNVWGAGRDPTWADYNVTFVDWADVIESVPPKVGRPLRIEVTLYKVVPANDTWHGHFMALLANPSSKDEVQGTTLTAIPDLNVYSDGIYYPGYATMVTSGTKMVIQKWPVDQEPGVLPETDWDGAKWTSLGEPTLPSFAVELNVGGKYIFGGSRGGWKPTQTGFYRLTFALPPPGVSLGSAFIGNYGASETESETGGGATPVVVGGLNLTYADVEVVAGGGGPKN